jgi:uncharacterized protein
MNPIEKRMVRMLKKHHIFTLATSYENKPWCATCFYIFDETQQCIIFTSDKNTRHIMEGVEQPEVSGAIALETFVIGKIRGIQFSGFLEELVDEHYVAAKKQYLKRFPYSAPYIKTTALWVIKLTFLKMTDNRMGFGNKIIWSKNP